MAIQFPPIAQGDPEPNNGDTYLYTVTGEEYECRRSSLAEAAQWAAVGVVQDTIIGYQGNLEITEPAPNADKGDIFTVIDGGTADASFTGLAGTEVEQWSLVIFADPQWNRVNTGASGPWVRTTGGRIQPTILGDDLDMVEGDYLINTLPTLEVLEPGTEEVSEMTTLFNLDLYGVDEDVRNVCNACDGNPDTAATATNTANTIHVQHSPPDNPQSSDDFTEITDVTNSVEVKILPNHYLRIQFLNEQGTELEQQANSQGIAQINNASGRLGMVRISPDPFDGDGDPAPQNTPLSLFYIKVDGNYLVDPTC